ELVVAARDLGDRRLAGQHGVGNALRVELNRAHRVVVARDRIVDAFGRAVRVDDGDDRNAELARLANRDLLVTDVDDEDAVGQRVHVLDAAERTLQLVALARKTEHFFLRELTPRRAALDQLVELVQALDRL